MNRRAGAVRGSARCDTAWLARAATVALYDELALHPKPGLVSFVDAGSHDDMDASTFLRSIAALRAYFVEIAALGADDAPFPALEAAAMAAEARMLAATGGANTHRGAIFTLGLLVAAGGALVAEGRALDAKSLRATLRTRWRDALVERRGRDRDSHGRRMARELGLRTVEDEAIDGFPTLFACAVPTLSHQLARGVDARRARVQTLLAIVATLDDTVLAHRGGRGGLHGARAMARVFLERGGVHAPAWEAAALRLHRIFVARRLSAGGAADLLAAACWVVRVTSRLRQP